MVTVTVHWMAYVMQAMHIQAHVHVYTRVQLHAHVNVNGNANVHVTVNVSTKHRWIYMQAHMPMHMLT